MDSPQEPIIFELEASECPTDMVTVFSDRAEVTRNVEVKETKTGQQEVRINGLPNGIRPDSIHVAGGRGSATVLEVSYDVVYKEVIKEGERERLEGEIEEMEEKMEDLEREKKRIEEERTLLDRYTSRVFDNKSDKPSSPQDSDVSTLFSATNLGGVSNYLRFVGENTERLDKLMAENTKNQKKLKEETQTKRNKLSILGSSSRTKETRRVTIVFLTKTETKVSFGLVYIVNGASWNPSYDVRITSADEEKEGSKHQLALTYYGKIQQNTGEDWNNAKLSLSTASPSSAANAPVAIPRTLSYYKAPSYSFGGKLGKPSPSFKRSSSTTEKKISQAMDYDEYEEDNDDGALDDIEIQQATTKKNAISATFEIPRRTSIQSDNKPHKVTIVILDLEPRMEYFCVPRANDNAYLRALAENKTQVALLPGPASVFLDNDFIATSDLTTASTGIEYQFLLGIDSEIRIKHEEVKTVAAQSGLIKKTKDVVVEHKTSVVNTKKKSITMIVLDTLPTSSEENIKVKLEEPDLKKSPNATYDEHDGKISWKIEVNAGGSVTVPFKFKVEYPADKTVVGLDETEK
eukprot:TRINITY_DN5997_c0_g2_i2.p1 TRINITY_DN5997_c0_g2~~TRINITY_DN5997_c0_g2_i2.p1  ORF type:complete len:576 (-),score=205.76 TRINITY_DN5997_c0_g2_i2:23-1750(-)